MEAFKGMEKEMEGREGRELWYVDLNAVSPATARGIEGMWEGRGKGVRVVDGGVCMVFYFGVWGGRASFLSFLLRGIMHERQGGK